MKHRIHCNKWGNWNGYVGTRRVIEFGLDWRAAEEWLANPEQHAAARAASPVRPATALDKTAGT